jgi:hypothetical protein
MWEMRKYGNVMNVTNVRMYLKQLEVFTVEEKEC